MLIASLFVSLPAAAVDPDEASLTLQDLPSGFSVQRRERKQESQGPTLLVAFTRDPMSMLAGGPLFVSNVISVPRPPSALADMLAELVDGMKQGGMGGVSVVDGPRIGDESQWYHGQMSSFGMSVDVHVVGFFVGESSAIITTMDLPLLGGKGQADAARFAEIVGARLARNLSSGNPASPPSAGEEG
jgi:hypothetical protein